MEKGTKNNFVSGLIIGAIIAAVVVFFGQGIIGGNVSPDKAKTMVTNFVNTKLLGGQATAKLDQLASAGAGLYKVKFTINGKPIDSYMTKDGKLFFPEAFPMSSSTSSGADQASTVVTKSDKPKVELFVMSYCPYGTQIEKGIIPAVQALGDKVDFKLKFVNYAMHGEKELKENLRQYCIEKDQTAKLLPYLTCFLKSDDSTSCVGSTGIDQEAMDSCVASADKEFKVTEQFTGKKNWNGNFPPFDVHKAENEKYGVQGSPTLVINGAQAEAGRDSASLLKTICSAFNKQPEICTTAKLSSDSPAPGFGEGTEAPAAAGQPAAGCATN